MILPDGIVINLRNVATMHIKQDNAQTQLRLQFAGDVAYTMFDLGFCETDQAILDRWWKPAVAELLDPRGDIINIKKLMATEPVPPKPDALEINQVRPSPKKKKAAPKK